MEKLDDYYSILQVHHMAEPEVIESAYKRLCMKYHPDVNRSVQSIEKMKQINRAYEILGNAEKRKIYHELWKQNSMNRHSAASEKIGRPYEEGMLQLENYFYYISRKEYAKAFELISDYDKNTIKYNDFIRWQEAVSKVFIMGKYKCTLFNVFNNVVLGDEEFAEVIECSVNLTEKNAKTGIVSDDEITKYIVREGAFWNVFLGYKQLQPIIAKYEGLAELKVVVNSMEYWYHMQIRIDHRMGLMNIMKY